MKFAYANESYITKIVPFNGYNLRHGNIVSDDAMMNDEDLTSHKSFMIATKDIVVHDEQFF